jgi:hypothetical protein
LGGISVSKKDRTGMGGDPMDNDKTIIERLVRIEQDAQSIYDEAKAEKEKRRQELEAKIAAFDNDADAELSAKLSAVKTRIVREHSESTNRMEADMSRALRMLDEEFASQMKKDADEIVKEILK